MQRKGKREVLRLESANARTARAFRGGIPLRMTFRRASVGCKEMGAIARALEVKIRSRGGCATQSKSVVDAVHERAQLARTRWMAQLAQCFRFDLADALARYRE